MCVKHAICLMLRQIAGTDNVSLACPYSDMEELGGGAEERSIIDEALRENWRRPN